MSKPPKQITKAERDVHKAFRQVDAKKAMTEHEIAQKAFSNNRERLKAERPQGRLRGPRPRKPRPPKARENDGGPPNGPKSRCIA
jgi:hypothetical protein